MVDEATGTAPPSGGQPAPIKLEVPATPAVPADGGKPGTAAPPAANPSLAALAVDGKVPAVPAAPAPPVADDWRKTFAGDDAKEMTRLQRFASQADMYKAYRTLEARMSSGKMTAALSPTATPEEKATWRKENGVPESADKYDTAIGEGFVWGDNDKPVLEDFTKHALANDMTPGEVKKSLSWYAKFQADAMAKQSMADDASARDGNLELVQRWGPETPRNLGAFANYFADMEPKMRDALYASRMPDGSRLGNNPDFIAYYAQKSREANPYATLVPAGTSDPAKNIADRRAELEGPKFMGDRSSTYWRGPQADAIQKEYRDIVGAMDTMKKRT